MPHATLPPPGFQALILCGPGASLTTFTSTPQDIPKALLPIANRPMVWYPLEWCYRMGITEITIITPPESLDAIEAAMSQDRHLTALPTPRADIVAPKDLTHQTGTGEIFRLPEVQDAVKSDFIVLPCDLVCELDGTQLVDAWMIEEAGFGAASGGLGKPPIGIGGENLGRRGGLGVWYQTGSVKKEETDFVATTPLQHSIVPPPPDSLRSHISKLVYTAPTDTIKDITEESNCLPIRHSLIRRHARIRMRTTYRDAHIYLFPYWVMALIQQNVKMESIAEDVLGWWAKAGWQPPLADKLGLGEILRSSGTSLEDSQSATEDIDVSALSSTFTAATPTAVRSETKLASRVQNANIPQAATSLTINPPLAVPPILAYIQPPEPSTPLIRRVDTTPLLLTISLRLAALPPASPNPFSHASKVAPGTNIPTRCRIDTATTLVAENVVVEEKVSVRESVIGANCIIGEGARLVRCLLMEGAVVGSGVVMEGCVVGRRGKVEGRPTEGEKEAEGTVLVGCEIQDGWVVEWGTEAKNEKFMRFDLPSEDDDSAAGGQLDESGDES
ncbi:hypothetical protein EJ04DRAFT_424131 [Polyplosphaeria fusca]|uniref:Mannose-1-phosphate guanyltransferase n=1 Tax=Polyplosphaeria fusca TaxID=682080 RepID=A0A9P4RC58_9PLEO|nr:hypothetical protein EJ04DRAFT_424131 [Polyplosphaeria fusca]